MPLSCREAVVGEPAEEAPTASHWAGAPVHPTTASCTADTSRERKRKASAGQAASVVERFALENLTPGAGRGAWETPRNVMAPD